jgi:hypothetical protein
MVAAAVAAAFLLAGTWAPRWWTGGDEQLKTGVGLRGAELCGERGCASRGLDSLGSGSPAWRLCGATAFATGWVAAFFLLGATLAAARRPGAIWSRRIARGAAGLALFSLVLATGFAVTYPGFAGLSFGWAAFAYLGGAAVGTTAAGVLLARA